MSLKVNVVNKSQYPLPEYKTSGSAGVDLYADIEKPITLRSLERELIPTGIYIALPEGYKANVCPRSGLAIKNGITVHNTPGLIDSDYRGEIKVILVNLSNTPYTINPGDRIAQLVITKVERVEFVEVSQLDETERGEGGFGSTGKK